ncbi:RNA/RNP complex-1-interacting phosphatase isoform X2 [Candoia aspera]|uniref:RNA/RNP complex-1-interacting phosphatase isoform X2 n=1 Tax=Candoia aspera TaxID=51853 RepID=UPI002FD86833
MGARVGGIGLRFRGAAQLSRPAKKLADGDWARARCSGPPAGGAAPGGRGGDGVPRSPPLSPSAWQGPAGSLGSAHGRKPEAEETTTPGQAPEGDARGESGSRPSGAMGKRKTGLPDRWTDYLPLGRRMPGTRFIAFKVPLKKSFEWRLTPDEHFSPLDLITRVKEQKEELGLIIDLTCTTRYYEPMELPDTLQYCKISTVGREVPNDAIVSKFKSAVKKFLKDNQHNDKLIGVHCTHGLNRTGYLVCRYLIDAEGMAPNMAIDLFNRCRGHSIERKNYISALQKTPEKRNHNMAISQRDWMKGHVGHTPSSDSEVVEYGPQNWKHAPRKHSQTWNQNLITCYNGGNQTYSPQHPPAANIIHQRSHHVSPSSRLFSPQQQFPGYQRPCFQIQNPHCSLQQHRNQLDKQHYWIP